MKNISLFNIENQLLCCLLLKASVIKNLGLLNGKMGLAIFFYHYYKLTNDPLFEDTASELIDEIKDQINIGLSIGFKDGLTGIGWGVEYLIQNGFVEGNAIDVCSEIDQKIMECNPSRMNDLSLDTGLCGLFHYVLCHIKGCQLQKVESPFHPDFLSELYCSAVAIEKNKTIMEDLKVLTNIYQMYYLSKKDVGYDMQLATFVNKNIDIKNSRISNESIGLQHGLAGAMLKIKHIISE